MTPSIDNRPIPARRARGDSLDLVDTMAAFAGETRSAVHVVVPREPGVVEHARAAARTAQVGISVDLLPATIRVRFDGSAS